RPHLLRRLETPSDCSQVFDEAGEGMLAVLGAKHRRRMDRRGGLDSRWQREKLAAPARDAKLPPEHGLRRGRAETTEDPRFDEADFGFPPVSARGDLGGVRLLVKPDLAGGPPLEMLHRIREIHDLT